MVWRGVWTIAGWFYTTFVLQHLWNWLKPKEQQQQTALTQITVVQNWFEELKRRVPTGTK